MPLPVKILHNTTTVISIKAHNNEHQVSGVKAWSTFHRFRNGKDVTTKKEKEKKTDDLIISGYTFQGLPFMIVADGYFGDDPLITNYFIKTFVVPLLGDYVAEQAAISDSNQSSHITKQLIKNISQLHQTKGSPNYEGAEDNPGKLMPCINSDFTMSIAVIVQRHTEGSLHCVGFGIGDTGIIAYDPEQSPPSLLEDFKTKQLAYETTIFETGADGVVRPSKDAFHRKAYQNLDAVIDRNSLFDAPVKRGVVLFGYTSLLKYQKSTGKLIPTNFGHIQRKNFAASTPNLRGEDSFHKYFIEDTRVYVELMKGLYADNSVSDTFGDDCTIGHSVVPLKKDQNKYALGVTQDIRSMLLTTCDEYITYAKQVRASTGNRFARLLGGSSHFKHGGPAGIRRVEAIQARLNSPEDATKMDVILDEVRLALSKSSYASHSFNRYVLKYFSKNEALEDIHTLSKAQIREEEAQALKFT